MFPRSTLSLMDKTTAALWESLLTPITPTLFPLKDKIPMIPWGSLASGEQVPATPVSNGFGIALGSRSGDLVVIDVDCKDGAPGFESLARLEKELGPLPDTLTVRTKSEGLHLYFVAPSTGSKNDWAPGIDVKSEGGMVVVPGSPGYVVEDQHPPAILPDAWRAAMPVPGGSRVSLSEVETETCYDIPGEIKKACHYKRGPVWDAWRRVLKGECPFTLEEAQNEAGGVDNYIRLNMFTELAFESPVLRKVEGEALAAVTAPAWDAFRMREEPATKWTNPYHVASKWDDTRRYVQEVVATPPPEPEAPSDTPWLVSKDGFVMVLDPRQDPPQYREGKRTQYSILASCAQLWADCPDAPKLTAPDKRGIEKPISFPSLAARAPLIEVDNIVRSFGTNRPFVKDETLTLPAAPLTVQPHPHEDVLQWLQALGGEVLLDWVACVPKLDYASPGLWIVGKAGIGKTVLARGLARIWDLNAQPVDGPTAFTKFNADLERCPVVFADEKVPENFRGQTDIDRLKQLISDTSRTVEAKYQPTRTLHGALRVIIASNDMNAIRNMGRIDSGNIAAMEERFVFLERYEAPAPRYFASAERIQKGWIEEGAIAETALHLAQTREVEPGGRFIMAPHSADMVRNLLTMPDLHVQILGAVAGLTSRAAAALPGEEADRHAVFMPRRDAVAVQTRTVQRYIQETREQSPTAAALGRMLATLTGAGKTTVQSADGKRSVWAIPTELLTRYATQHGDEHELEGALAVLRSRHG